MQNVSALYKSIVSGEHWFTTTVGFETGSGWDWIDEGELISIHKTQALFSENKPMVGCACCGECEITLFKPDYEFPRMGGVIIYIYATDGTRTSEAVMDGVYNIDTREIGNLDGRKTITLHCYDAMARAFQDFPSTSHSWPAPTATVVSDIASAMGVNIDSRTSAILSATPYNIPLPAGYSCAEVLKGIATMYMGNWYITEHGNLRLVGINDLPPESRYLIDNIGNAITFGGVRILV